MEKKVNSKKRVLLISITISIAFIVIIVFNIKGFLSVSKKVEGSKTFVAAVKGDLRVAVSCEGEIQPKKTININSKVRGRTTIIKIIPEGTRVRKGDFLVKLDSKDIEERLNKDEITLESSKESMIQAEKDIELQKNQNESDIKKAQLDIKIKEMEMEKYSEGEHPQKLRTLDLKISQGKTKLEQAKTNIENTEKLYKRGFVTKKDLEDAKMNLETAEVNLESAELEKELYLKYTYPKNMKIYESNLEEAKKSLKRKKQGAESRLVQKEVRYKSIKARYKMQQMNYNKLKDQLKKTEINAPADGIVLYYSRRWQPDIIKEGAQIYENQPIILLPDMSSLLVKCRVNENDIRKVKMGQNCEIIVDALPGKKIKGKVSKIGTFADQTNRWMQPDVKVFIVETEITDTGVELKPGLSANVEIIIDVLKDVVYVPVQCVLNEKGKYFCFLQNAADQPEKVEVEPGLANDSYVSIKKGLKQGDKVIILEDTGKKFAGGKIENKKSGRTGKKQRRQGAHK